MHKMVKLNIADDFDYEKLKNHYDTVLNKDKTTFKTSNDEPTPISCIEEILNVIPDDFWKKENLKILDPCCGNGNFHLVAINKFIKSGRNFVDINKYLYYNDINKERLQNVIKYLYPIHITDYDFLEHDYENELYDMIYNNPPYALLLQSGKRASKNHNLSQLFLTKSLSLVKPGGYLCYLIPDNWMSLSQKNKIIKELTSLQFHKLSIHVSKKWFPKIGSSFTWFVIEKTPYYKDFTVEYLYKNHIYHSIVSSKTREFIPLIYSDIVQSILSKTIEQENRKFKVETSSDLHHYTKKEFISPLQDDTFKYRLIHTPKQTVWAKRPHKYQDGYKVFISITDKYQVFIDNCGMTQSIAFIQCGNDLKQAQQYEIILKHPLYVFFNNICRYGNFNNVRILQKFPIPNNDDVYQSFNISLQEQEFIHHII